jgi:predicted dehydrogenase
MSSVIFLFLGLGSIGQRHLTNVYALGEHEIISYRRRGLVLPEEVSSRITANVSSLEEGIAQRPDAAFVCGPTSHHLSDALTLAEAHVNVFIEKPVSHTLDGVDRLLDLNNRNQLTSMVGYNLRFHEPLRVIYDLVKGGEIGRVLGANASVGQYLPSWHPTEDYREGYSALIGLGGGVVMDLSHEIDYMLWICGPATHVFGVTGRVGGLEIETEDTADIILQLEAGHSATIHLDYLQSPAARELKIYGTGGAVSWDGMSDSVVKVDAAGNSEILWDHKTERNESFMAEVDHYLKCLVNGDTPTSSLEDGLQTLKVIDGVRRSAASGQVISI